MPSMTCMQVAASKRPGGEDTHLRGALSRSNPTKFEERSTSDIRVSGYHKYIYIRALNKSIRMFIKIVKSGTSHTLVCSV